MSEKSSVKRKPKPLPLYKTEARSAKEYVRRICSLLSKGRTTGTNSKNASGVPVSAHAPDSVSVCLVGAIFRAKGGDMLRWKIEDSIDKQLRGKSYARFNDDPKTTTPQVIALVRRAAKKLGVKDV